MFTEIAVLFICCELNMPAWCKGLVLFSLVLHFIGLGKKMNELEMEDNENDV